MDSIEKAKAEADEAYRMKVYENSVEAYSRAIGLSEDQQRPDLLHLLYSNRSAAKLALQDYQGALADAQRSVAVDESWVKGWYRSAKALQGLGKLDLATQAAQKAQQLEPNNKDVQLLLQQLKQQHQAGPAATATHQATHQAAQQDNTTLTQPQQQPMQQQRLPWSDLNKQRSRLDLKRLPQQLVVGSKYVPSSDGINQNLLLLLHGLGDTPVSYTSLAQRMALPQTASLALSGPLPAPETDGGRMWYTTFEDDGECIQALPGETRRTDSLAVTLTLLQQLLFEVLPALGGWRPDQIQLLGFSQGACVSMELVRVLCKAGRQPLGGVVAIASGLLKETLAQLASSSASTTSSSQAVPNGGSGTPVLITYGTMDDVVDRERVDGTVGVLQAAGCPVQLQVLPGKGHAMINSEPEMRACMTFWAKHLKHRPADPGFVEVA